MTTLGWGKAPLGAAPFALCWPYCFSSVATGQSFTGSLLGVITDSTGAVIPNATVVASSRETGEHRIARTTAVGQFSVTGLPPGAYDLDVEADGFRRYRRENLRVQVLQDVRIDVGETPLLETSNASVGQVIENARIVDLPLNGRNTLSLVSLTAWRTSTSRS